jgi:hypothetical protein
LRAVKIHHSLHAQILTDEKKEEKQRASKHYGKQFFFSPSFCIAFSSLMVATAIFFITFPIPPSKKSASVTLRIEPLPCLHDDNKYTVFGYPHLLAQHADTAIVFAGV